MEQSTLTTNVTNIFKKVENVYVTNSVQTAAHHHEELSKEKCRIHGDRALDFVCVICDEEICRLCKLSEHEGHETKSICLVADEAKTTLLSVLDGRVAEYSLSLLSMRQRTEQQIRALETEERTTKEKLNERYAHLLSVIGVESQEACHLLVKVFQDRLQRKLTRSKNGVPQIEFTTEESLCAVRLRQAVLKDMTHAILTEKLFEVEDIKTGALCELGSSLRNIERELASVSLLRERVKVAVSEKNHVAILDLNRQVMIDFSAERTRAKLCKCSPAFNYTLQHQADREIDELKVILDVFWSDRKNEVERYFQDVLGGPVETKTPTADRPDAVLFDVKLAFRFCEERQAIVSSLCPMGEDKIMVSFATKPNETKGMRKTFFLDGRPVDSESSELCSLASFPNSRGGSAVYMLPTDNPCMSLPPSQAFSVYAKFQKHYKLTLSKVQSDCCLQFFVAMSDSQGVHFFPLDNTSWTVGGMGTTAFDASRDGRMFAVVNVTQDTTCNAYGMTDGVKFIRQVLVLCRNSAGKLSRWEYEPPTSESSPTDVCFYDLGGEEVLLVADMGSNSIQVARQSDDDGEFVFDRYLVETHPLLRCPTALNTDREGRLWVACQGGNLLTVQSI